MKIEDISIEDAVDANYVIRKFFNNDLKNIRMNQLEQLVLTVYTMGKKNGVSGVSNVSGVSDVSDVPTVSAVTDSTTEEIEPEPAPKAPAKPNPYKVNNRVKILEDIEIGHSGEFINANSTGRVTAVNGDIVTVLFEADEEGEMIEIDISFDKLEENQ